MRDVVPELGAQPLGGLPGVGVTPGPERRQQPAVGVESEIAVHHGRDAERAHGGQVDVIALPDLFGQCGVAL